MFPWIHNLADQHRAVHLLFYANLQNFWLQSNQEDDFESSIWIVDEQHIAKESNQSKVSTECQNEFSIYTEIKVSLLPGMTSGRTCTITAHKPYRWIVRQLKYTVRIRRQNCLKNANDTTKHNNWITCATWTNTMDGKIDPNRKWMDMARISVRWMDTMPTLTIHNIPIRKFGRFRCRYPITMWTYSGTTHSTPDHRWDQLYEHLATNTVQVDTFPVRDCEQSRCRILFRFKDYF